MVFVDLPILRSTFPGKVNAGISNLFPASPLHYQHWLYISRVSKSGKNWGKGISGG